MTDPLVGISESLYIGGVTWASPPDTVTPSWLDAKESARAKSGRLYRDFLQPSPDRAVLTRVLRLTLSWATMNPADIRTANGIIARATDELDVCDWLEISEAFWFATGAAFAGTLKRRNALTVVTPLPTGAATYHAVTATRGDGSALSLTLGSPDADGLTPWTAAGTSVGEYVTVNYTPVYLMAVDDAQPSFPQPNVTAQTLVLEEAV